MNIYKEILWALTPQFQQFNSHPLMAKLVSSVNQLIPHPNPRFFGSKFQTLYDFTHTLCFLIENFIDISS